MLCMFRTFFVSIVTTVLTTNDGDIPSHLVVSFRFDICDASSQIPSQDLGCSETEAGHLRPSSQTLPPVSGAKDSHACSLETSRSGIQSQPKDWCEGTCAGCSNPHLLSARIPGRTMGWRGFDKGLQICQQWQSEELYLVIIVKQLFRIWYFLLCLDVSLKFLLQMSNRLKKIWKPELFKRVLYSEILDHKFTITVTLRTLDLIDAAYGFDFYILKVSHHLLYVISN